MSDKLPLIKSLLERCDRVLVGGAMCFTFLAAQGEPVGASLHEGPRGRRWPPSCMELAVRLNCALQLPVDVLVADRFAADAALEVVPTDDIADGWMGVDIGPRTAASYREAIAAAGTVFWNGPMGAFEIEPFADGTRAVAEAMAASSADTVAGGGDSGGRGRAVRPRRASSPTCPPEEAPPWRCSKAGPCRASPRSRSCERRPHRSAGVARSSRGTGR